MRLSFGNVRSGTYIGLVDQVIESVADPFEIHCRLWKVLTGDLNITMLRALSESDSRVLRRGGCPPGSGQQAEFVDSVLIVQRKLRNGNCDSTLHSDGVLFPTVRHGSDNEGGF